MKRWNIIAQGLAPDSSRGSSVTGSAPAASGGDNAATSEGDKQAQQALEPSIRISNIKQKLQLIR